LKEECLTCDVEPGDRPKPPEFFRWEDADNRGSWVLDHGLAPLPTALGDGDAVPVAYWVGPHVGVVLFRSLYQAEHGDSGRDVDDSHRLYRRSVAGWEPVGGDGGSSGPFLEPLSRLNIPARHAAIRNEFRFGDQAGLTGIVGTAATTIELADGASVTRRAVDAPVSVFVVCFRFDDHVTLRILGSDARLLLDHTLGPRHATPSG
jgi:hypothetical protein